MNNKTFNKLSEKICDGNGNDLDHEERYNFIKEVSQRIGLPLFEAFLIENTIDYSEVYASESSNKNEVILHIINGNYDLPCMDDIETCSWEICQDLGYEIEY